MANAIARLGKPYRARRARHESENRIAPDGRDTRAI